MVNRVLEAKRLKIKRQREGLRPWSDQRLRDSHGRIIKTAYLKHEKRSANTVLIREFHGSAQGLSAFERWFFNLTHVPDDVTLASQNARRAELGLPSSIQRSSREDVQRLMMFVEEPLKHSVVLTDLEDLKLMMFWSVGPQAQWYFIKYDYMRAEFSKSKKYWTREKAMKALRLDRILWVGVEKLK